MSETHKELTKEIANFVVATRLENTPRDVIARGQIHLLDALGLGIAGTESAVFKKIKTYIGTGDQNKTSSIFCMQIIMMTPTRNRPQIEMAVFMRVPL